MLIRLQKNGVLNIKVDPSEKERGTFIKYIHSEEGMQRFRDRRYTWGKNRYVINYEVDENGKYQKQEVITGVPVDVYKFLKEIGIDPDRTRAAVKVMAALNRNWKEVFKGMEEAKEKLNEALEEIKNINKKIRQST